MTIHAHNCVVVGVDVSEPAAQAAAWAAREAATRRRPLVVVHAFEERAVALASLNMPEGVTIDIPLREAAEAHLRETVERCRGVAVGVEVSGEFVDGDPVDVLTEASLGATLVVLGSSGAGAVARVLMGSTSSELVRRSHAPVIVVRGKDSPAERAVRRVVVGVDGSSTSARAITFAYDFAERHDAELVAVLAWQDLPLDAFAPVRTWDIDWEMVKQRAVSRLAESLAGEHERFPDVPVHKVVTGDRPTKALLDQIDESSLLVVGSHGRGAVGRMLLGSVSHAMLHYAPCPVAVVRATR